MGKRLLCRGSVIEILDLWDFPPTISKGTLPTILLNFLGGISHICRGLG